LLFVCYVAMMLSGKNVAMLDVHFEGNVGDQMETIPLLRQLSAWGVNIDCYLRCVITCVSYIICTWSLKYYICSHWLHEEKRVAPWVLPKVKNFVSSVYEKGIIDGDPTDISRLNAKNYDAIIMSPGT
jgi:hypothetical protein